MKNYLISTYDVLSRCKLSKNHKNDKINIIQIVDVRYYIIMNIELIKRKYIVSSFQVYTNF